MALDKTNHAVYEGSSIELISLDLSVAFDTIFHSKLLNCPQPDLASLDRLLLGSILVLFGGVNSSVLVIPSLPSLNTLLLFQEDQTSVLCFPLDIAHVELIASYFGLSQQQCADDTQL